MERLMKSKIFKMAQPLLASLTLVLLSTGCEMVTAEGETIALDTTAETEAMAQAQAQTLQKCQAIRPKRLMYVMRYENGIKKHFLLAEIDNPDAQRALGLRLSFTPNDNSVFVFNTSEYSLLREGSKSQLVTVAKSNQRFNMLTSEVVTDVSNHPYFVSNTHVSLCSTFEKQDLAFYAEAGRQYSIEKSRNKLIWKKVDVVANPDNRLVWRASNPVVGDETKGVEYYRVKVSCTTNFDCRNENKRLDESTDEIRRLYK
ncbi:MAG TPA: hypothetical protein VM901_09375 [Bdellovibrionota bacterium]|nr:hypothetical protein [Bdellovibrionota bacterium]